jgi:hypothetical protein
MEGGGLPSSGAPILRLPGGGGVAPWPGALERPVAHWGSDGCDFGHKGVVEAPDWQQRAGPGGGVEGDAVREERPVGPEEGTPLAFPRLQVGQGVLHRGPRASAPGAVAPGDGQSPHLGGAGNGVGWAGGAASGGAGRKRQAEPLVGEGVGHGVGDSRP